MGMGTLPEQFADRLPEKDLQRVISYRNAGEWGEAVANLIAALHQSRATISTREAQALRDFLETFQPGWTSSDTGARILEKTTHWLEDLPVIQSLTGPELVQWLREIPERFRNRLSPAEIEQLTVRPDEEEAEVWFEVAYDLMKALHRSQAPISSQERMELWLILDALDLPRHQLKDLPVA